MTHTDTVHPAPTPSQASRRQRQPLTKPLSRWQEKLKGGLRVWESFRGHYRPLEGIQDLPRDQVETIKAPREKKRFDWTASKTKCVTFPHLCRRVPHIYAGIGFTWILTPAQKRVGFYWDLSSSHGRWIGKNSAFLSKVNWEDTAAISLRETRP